MHHYPFHVGDYASHTQHLDEIEDLAYRRMLDYCYLNECGLPETVEAIARVIRMRTHCERIATVLLEFFEQHCDGTYHNKRADLEIAEYRKKSDKARESASKRWKNTDANALRTHCQGNANQNQNQNQLNSSLSVIISSETQISAEIVSMAAEQAGTSEQFAAECCIGFIAHYDGESFTDKQLISRFAKWVDREWRFINKPK